MVAAAVAAYLAPAVASKACLLAVVHSVHAVDLPHDYFRHRVDDDLPFVVAVVPPYLLLLTVAIVDHDCVNGADVARHDLCCVLLCDFLYGVCCSDVLSWWYFHWLVPDYPV